MSKKLSSNSNSTSSTKEEETSIIFLIPCDYDSSEQDDEENVSQNSIESSEVVSDSDDEVEMITYFERLNKNFNKVEEKSNEINFV